MRGFLSVGLLADLHYSCLRSGVGHWRLVVHGCKLRIESNIIERNKEII